MIHLANVDVDVKGTKAAAAIAVIMAQTSTRIEPTERPEPVVFRADHSFLFLIREIQTGSILSRAGNAADAR